MISPNLLQHFWTQSIATGDKMLFNYMHTWITYGYVRQKLICRVRECNISRHQIPPTFMKSANIKKNWSARSSIEVHMLCGDC
jgi:hypothetical protein